MEEIHTPVKSEGSHSAVTKEVHLGSPIHMSIDKTRVLIEPLSQRGLAVDD